MKYKHIILLTDLSDASRAAFSSAQEFARDQNAELIVLSVFSEFHIPALLMRQMQNETSMPALKAEYELGCLKEVQDFVKDSFTGQIPKIELVFSTAPAADAIAGAIKAPLDSLLILSSHGRGALSNFFVGSTLARLVQLAPCPILVVPYKK
jgi:nucleotide-binding universal stress UspA family protein